MAAQRIVVRGRVQGVGFRYHAQQAARSLGVAGLVWNRADGGVEIIAEHVDGSVLAQYLAEIEAGPGRILDVMAQPVPEIGYVGFDVGPTR